MVHWRKRNEFKSNVEELDSDLTIYPTEIIPTQAKEKRLACPELFLISSRSSPAQCLLCPDLGPEESIMKGFFLPFKSLTLSHMY